MDKNDFQDSVIQLMQQFQDAVNAQEMSEVLVKTGCTVMFYLNPAILAKLQILEWVNYIYDIVI